MMLNNKIGWDLQRIKFSDSYRIGTNRKSVGNIIFVQLSSIRLNLIERGMVHLGSDRIESA